ncbi:GntR family transcriptional regulator [Streptosporangium sp. NBC_01469]|uniref:GntR family transcriptional regulator n=1 Tax=Streptosporangium sp. NBC_01469 TaxID=2903898 RepID=UPI002E2A0200|nr:GntR family transcriptional regulator [Streptosporangium sp. NBC_01469]
MAPGESKWLTGGLVYPQIAGRIRARIAAGDYPPGSLLPSESALVAEFRVSRTTARRGLAVLESEGLIIVMPGKGRVVRDDGSTLGASYRYQMIAHDLREQIRAGTLAAGTTLPSERALRQRHGASRNTVRQALAELEREGLITTEHGKGRFVRPIQGETS